MATFAIYNYQFAKIIRRAREGRLFPKDAVEMDAEEAFPQRQQIMQSRKSTKSSLSTGEATRSLFTDT